NAHQQYHQQPRHFACYPRALNHLFHLHGKEVQDRLSYCLAAPWERDVEIFVQLCLLCSRACRAAANSFRFWGSTLGYDRLRSSSVSTIAAATARRVNHLLSAGMTNQGVCGVAVLAIISWYACM